MTLRLSAFFEEQIRTITSEYKTAVKSSDRLRRSQRFRKKMQQQDQPSASSRFVLSYVFCHLVCLETGRTSFVLWWISCHTFLLKILLLTILSWCKCQTVTWFHWFKQSEQIIWGYWWHIWHKMSMLMSDEILLFSSQKRAAVQTQEKVESTSVTKSTSAKVSVPERARRSRRSSSGHSSSEDSKAASSTPGTKRILPRKPCFHHRN